MMDKIILENPRPVSIYTLTDPETGKIRYVGKTVDPLTKRLGNHISLSNKCEFHSSRWIRSLLSKNLKPIISLIETCDENNWEERERHHIKTMRETCDLTNILDGGVGLSEKQKKKLYDLREVYFKTIRKPICQYDWQGKFIKTWDGCRIAGKAIGISSSSISKSCLNKKSFIGGSYWRFLSETQEKDIKVIMSKDFKNITKMNKNYEVVQHYRTMRGAAVDVNSSCAAIKYAIVHDSCLRGFRWAYTNHEQSS